MNAILTKHGPKLMFVAVLALCAAYIAFVAYEPAEATMEKERVPANIEELNRILTAGHVSAKYAYNAEHAAKLKDFTATAKANQERLSKTTDDPTGSNENYPLPARPKSEVFKAGEIKEEVATLADVTEVQCHPDQGVLYVNFKIPDESKLKFMKLVRAEIFRGIGSVDKIDTSKPYGTVIVGPEEEPVAAPAAAVSPAAAIATAPEPDHRPRTPSGQAAKKTDKPKVSEAMKFVRVFKDTMVDQNITYFYQVRLIGRLTINDGEIKVTKRAPDNTPQESVRYHAPEGKDGKTLASVAPASPSSAAKLYATALSKDVSATAPTNYKLRLAGTHGVLPDPNRPRNPSDPLNKDYEGSFEVIVWIKDAQDWGKAMITAHEGEMLSGVAKLKGGASFDFSKDLGYKMLRIEMEEDKDAKIKTPVQMIETATLLNSRTNKEEKFPKAPNMQLRQAWLNQLDIISAEQEELNKVKKEKIKAVVEKNAAAAEERKQKLEQDKAAQDTDSQPSNPAAPPSRGGGGRGR